MSATFESAPSMFDCPAKRKTRTGSPAMAGAITARARRLTRSFMGPR